MADPIDKLLTRLNKEIMVDDDAAMLRPLTSRALISDFVEDIVEEALGKSNPAPVTREAGPATTVRSLEE